MGYDHWACKARCGKCGSVVGWFPPRGKEPKLPRPWSCSKCHSLNFLGRLPEWPNIPPTLYIGHDMQRQVKLYPFLPDQAWMQPYSVRSFVAQASRQLGGCSYETTREGSVMGEPVFRDICFDPKKSFVPDTHSCHFVAGFTISQPGCPLWDRVAALCQTEIEKRFLRWYLSLVKDRQFPMLIPQARIGIAERRRPDFVLFAPLQYWQYKHYAVELDGAHPQSQGESDQLRDAEIAVHGYEVISLRPEGRGYLEEVKRLVEQVERDMRVADADGWKVAIDVRVIRTEQDDEVPF